MASTNAYDCNELEEVAYSQEEECTQSQNEPTQLADLDDSGGLTNPPQPHLPLTPSNLRKIPWGRLIPCAAQSSSSLVDFDLLPKDPSQNAGSVTRSRSHSQSFSPPTSPTPKTTLNFLGLSNLKAGDRFNEHVIGRSNKCDIVASIRTTKNGNSVSQADWVHAMISNRHCRIFAILHTANSRSPDMEIYIEDSSGNGTLINQSTLLHRGERRILHTGDEICLINPPTLWKQVRSTMEQKEIVSHYSFIFVNLHQTRNGTSFAEKNDPNSMGEGQKYKLRSQNLFAAAVTTPNDALSANGKRRAVVDAPSTNRNSPMRHPQEPTRHEDMPPPEKKRRTSPRATSPKVTTQQRLQQLTPPRRVEEHYDIRDLLGSGTCGEVRRAIHRRTGVQVAVKIIATGGRNRSARLLETDSSIQSEATMLQSLHHPYIVQLLDVFIHPGTAVYLVMELLHGGDLFDRIVQKSKYSEVESRHIMRRILSAVHYLHEERNIVHRDLKPENILCMSRSNDIKVKLTDFGLAKSVTEDGCKTFCGTPQYFAPEVLRRRNTVAGRGRYGKEADMWSLGVILYILLCGVPPFDISEVGMDADAVAGAKIVFRESRWKGITSAAKDLVKKLLVPDPKQRYSVVNACEHDWFLVNDGDTHCFPLHDPVLQKEGFGKQQLGTADSKISSGKTAALTKKKATQTARAQRFLNSPSPCGKIKSTATTFKPNLQVVPTAEATFGCLDRARQRLVFDNDEISPDTLAEAYPCSMNDPKDTMAPPHLDCQPESIASEESNMPVHLPSPEKINLISPPNGKVVVDRTEQLLSSVDKEIAKDKIKAGLSDCGINETNTTSISMQAPSDENHTCDKAMREHDIGDTKNTPLNELADCCAPASNEFLPNRKEVKMNSLVLSMLPDKRLLLKTASSTNAQKRLGQSLTALQLKQADLVDDDILSEFSDDGLTNDSIQSFDVTLANENSITTWDSENGGETKVTSGICTTESLSVTRELTTAANKANGDQHELKLYASQAQAELKDDDLDLRRLSSTLSSPMKTKEEKSCIDETLLQSDVTSVTCAIVDSTAQKSKPLMTSLLAAVPTNDINGAFAITGTKQQHPARGELSTDCSNSEAHVEEEKMIRPTKLKVVETFVVGTEINGISAVKGKQTTLSRFFGKK